MRRLGFVRLKKQDRCCNLASSLQLHAAVSSAGPPGQIQLEDLKSRVSSSQKRSCLGGGPFETLIIRINHMLPVFAKCVVDVVAKWLYRPEDHMQICCILSRNLARLAFLFPGLVCWTDTKSLIKLQKHLVRSKWKASRSYSRWFQETWMINESMNSFLNRISAPPNSSFAPGSSRRLKRGTHCCNVIT